MQVMLYVLYVNARMLVYGINVYIVFVASMEYVENMSDDGESVHWLRGVRMGCENVRIREEVE